MQAKANETEGNLANAKTDGIDKDLHLVGNQVSCLSHFTLRSIRTPGCEPFRAARRRWIRLTTQYYLIITIFYVPLCLCGTPLSMRESHRAVLLYLQRQ